MIKVLVRLKGLMKKKLKLTKSRIGRPLGGSKAKVSPEVCNTGNILKSKSKRLDMIRKDNKA